jgi:hypothetical protein
LYLKGKSKGMPGSFWRDPLFRATIVPPAVFFDEPAAAGPPCSSILFSLPVSQACFCVIPRQIRISQLFPLVGVIERE